MDIWRALLLFSLLWITSLKSQQFSYKHFTTKDGLPSNKIYDCVQDKNGYLWFATNKGLTIYDGYSFSNFTHDSLPKGSILRLQADGDGKIWYFPPNKQFGYILNNNAYPSKDYKLIKEEFKKLNIENIKTYITNVVTDSNGGKWYTIYKIGIYNITKNGTVKHLKHAAGTKFPNEQLRLFKVGNQFISERGVCLKAKDKNALIIYDSNFNKINKFKLGNYTARGSFFGSSIVIKNKLYFSDGISLYEYDKAENTCKKLISFKTNILHVGVTPDNKLWISVLYNGLYIANTPSSNILDYKHFFKEKTISKVLFDHQSNMWATNNSEGAFFIKNSKISGFEIGKVNIINTDTTPKIGLESGKIMEYKNHDLSSYNSLDQISPIRDIKHYNNNTYILNDMCLFKNNSILISNLAGPKTIKIVNRKYFYLGHYAYLDLFYHSSSPFKTGRGSGVSLKPNEINSSKEIPNQINPSVQSICDFKNTFLTGGSKGMFIHKKDSLFRINELNVNQVKCNDSLVFAATNNSGIQILDDNLNTIDSINSENHLNCDDVYCILLDEDTLWSGTSCGLYKLLISKNEISLLEKFDDNNGLLSNSITALGIKENELFIGTSEGLNVTSKFIKNVKQKTEKEIPIFLKSVTCNELEVTTYSNKTFTYDSNYFEFNYVAINFSASKTDYEYKLTGLEDKWIKTQQTKLRFPNLIPGDYSFSVRAISPASKTKTYNFSIAKPFWNTWWFYYGLIITLITIVFWYINRLREKNKLLLETANLKENELDLRQKALTAQINPHFFFNVLASIQSFYIKNDIQSGNEYMSKFSRIMRLILYSSTDSYLLVEEEIELLKNYMSLEQIRAKNRFEYIIDTDPVLLEEEYKIPSMMLQPFIENAIKHGVEEIENGKIKISFILVNDTCAQIIIEDNGIGREASKAKNKLKDGLHRSKGMGIIRDRLNLMNKNKENNYSIKITDKENPVGTIVRITLPVA